MAGKYGLNERDRDIIGRTIRRVHGNGLGTVPYPSRRRKPGTRRAPPIFDCHVISSLTQAAWSDPDETPSTNSNAAVLLTWGGDAWQEGETISVEWIGHYDVTIETDKAARGWGFVEHGLYILRNVDDCHQYSYTPPE